MQNFGQRTEPVPLRGLLAADPVVDFDAGPPRVSFEFFPPKTAEMEARLWEVVQRLEPLAPRFFSVTYGAGGCAPGRTHPTGRRIPQADPFSPPALPPPLSAPPAPKYSGPPRNPGAAIPATFSPRAAA